MPKSFAPLPLWVKIVPTLLACVIVPAYLWKLGPVHFLWLSDIAFLMLVVALWRESPLINSMIAVGVLPMELAWNVDFFGRMLTGHPMFEFTGYMFDPGEPMFFRSLSLFHVLLPPLVIFLLLRWGYDRRALWVQSLLNGSVLLLSRFLSTQQQNINWVFGPGRQPQTWMDPLLYFALEITILFFGIMLPTHWILKRYFCEKPARPFP